MSYGDISIIGKKLGYDNVVQIQNIRRSFKNGKLGELKAQFEIPSTVLSEIMEKYQPSEDAFVIHDISKQFAPKSYSKDAKSIISIIINRFSPKSGTLSINAVTTHDGETLSSMSSKFLKNNAGLKLRTSGVSSEAGAKIDCSASLSTDTPNLNMDVRREFLDVVKYSENGSVGKLSINYGRPNTMNSFNCAVEAPTALFDKTMEQISKGELKNFGTFLDAAKKSFQ